MLLTLIYIYIYIIFYTLVAVLRSLNVTREKSECVLVTKSYILYATVNVTMKIY